MWSWTPGKCLHTVLWVKWSHADRGWMTREHALSVPTITKLPLVGGTHRQSQAGIKSHYVTCTFSVAEAFQSYQKNRETDGASEREREGGGDTPLVYIYRNRNTCPILCLKVY